MPIQAGDVALVTSRVMDDVPEGGGGPTAATILDGTSNSIFPDISELDRAGGRVNLRKVFASVLTNSVDTYFGANVIVAEPPTDPKVSVTLFSTGQVFDTRASAKGRIESYLSLGARYPGNLFGDHIAGQRIVTLLQRESIPAPAVGDTLVMRKNDGLPNQLEQYIKVIAVSSRVRTFTDTNGDFTRLEVSLTLSDALTADFAGLDANRTEPGASEYIGKTRMFSTIVADAARYYGVVPLTQAAALGDLVVKGASIFTQLVPSTKVEVPIADARMSQRALPLLKAGDPYTNTVNAALNKTQSLYIGGKILPGSFSLAVGSVSVNDKGGVLFNSDTAVGAIDYENGVVSVSTNIFGTGVNSTTYTYTPADTPTSVTSSVGVPVTAQGQRANWVFSIASIPARGTLQVSYRALSRWYVLSDDGSGAIRGSESVIGAGSVNFSTGTVSVTLGTLPDVGSQIILQWVDTSTSRPMALIPGQLNDQVKAFGKVVTINDAIKPGSLMLTWNDGAARTATDNNGALTGDATGTVNYATGKVHFCPKSLPVKNTAVAMATINAAAVIGAITTFTDGGANWTFSVVGPVRPRTLLLSIYTNYSGQTWYYSSVDKQELLKVVDDGAGHLQIANYDSNLTVGTINYTTGECTLLKTIGGYKKEENNYQSTSFLPDGTVQVGQVISKSMYIRTLNIQNGATTPPGEITSPWAWWVGTQHNAAELMYVGSDGTGQTYNFTLDSLFMPSAPVPSAFNLSGKRHFVTADNRLVRDISTTTGTGTLCGSIGAVSSVNGVVLTDWAAGASNAPNGIAGIDSEGTASLTDAVTFRTAVAPLFNGGFSLDGTKQNGDNFSVSPDINGIINNPASGVFGVVDFNNGICSLRFGAAVDDTHANDPGIMNLSYLGIAGVKYVKTSAVKTDSLRYNAVGYSYLPLDQNILGLDPVRLPTDGKVPIFRQGSFVVVGHTATINPGTVVNGQTINCARVRLSRIRVIAGNGQVINTGYTQDLEAGTITFVDVSSYVMPVTVEHRIEDMAMVTDAQINGQLTLSRALTHNFPVGSYVSSAMIIGDTHARVSVLFDQATFNNAWQDTVNGADAQGTYNDTLAPIVVTNKGALTERWAIRFTNTTSYDIIGEHVGVIGTGTTTADSSPINPAANVPYFTLKAIGFGSGWAVGNVLRFNTIGATNPIWVARTILQGPPTTNNDKFTLLVRGDIDQP
ncbi:hypothetical protein ACO0LF_12465 [Undibacterium sp. Di27W]|uniref:hypothetical protein n=1 Tax=Undibacterium sp. Di27W TaxID=3413036 RepID=UPI003BF03B59